MRRNYKIIIPIILLAGILFGFQIKKINDQNEEDRLKIGLIRLILERYHYEPHRIDNDFSIALYDNFITNLDPSKRYFTQEDVDEFSMYKTHLDDQIKNEDLSFYKLVYSRYKQRVSEAKEYYKDILANPFDFSKNETLDLDYENAPFGKGKDGVYKIWEKQLKASALASLYDKEEIQKAKEKDGEEFKKKSFTDLEKEAREDVQKNMERFYELWGDIDDAQWFSTYLNSMTAVFDPHTNYFTPKNKERFDVDMSGTFEGIGARLSKEGDYTKVVELISGGPAWRDGKLEVGDIILKVGQSNEEPIDIVGMRLDNAIEYIKGKKGTEVRLTVKKIDGSINVIPIIRDEVELEETFAKSSTVEKGGNLYGLIKLPKFYIDFKEKEARTAATDMKQEVENLKAQGVKGLIIDLRNNGGGSLSTAIDIAGLFIDKGPVVQVKYRGRDADVKSDKSNKIIWDGPLVILVNELSASASEILAAAMQDYKRAVIVGSKQTFGKGTVQTLTSLNDLYKYPKPLGDLKITIQKFYRINGGSTQLRGVSSDIVIPDRYEYMEIGEREQENPLPWDMIEKATYSIWNGYENYENVIKESQKEINANTYFNLINENAKWLKQIQDDNTAYLNYDVYKKDIEKRDEEGKKFDGIKDFKTDLVFKSPTYELPLIAVDSLLEKKRKVWHKNLAEDVYVDEALKVLEKLKVKSPKLVQN